jgi:hypothetical protein
MGLRNQRPVANGLRTDHPVPGLPFVDDAHLPLQDPQAIEAIGRRPEEGTWGRTDRAPHARVGGVHHRSERPAVGLAGALAPPSTAGR